MRNRILMGLVISSMLTVTACSSPMENNGNSSSSISAMNQETDSSEEIFNLADLVNEADTTGSTGNINADMSRHSTISEAPVGSTTITVNANDVITNMSALGADEVEAEAIITPEGNVHTLTLTLTKNDNSYAHIIIDKSNLPGFMEAITFDDGSVISKTTINNCNIAVREYPETSNEYNSMSDAIDIGIDKEGMGIWVILGTDYSDEADKIVNCLLESEINFDINVSQESTSACWHDHYTSVNDMESASDLIAYGKVISTEPELRGDLVFTRNYVSITKLIKGKISIDDEICILQTGGTYGDIYTPAFEEAPLLEDGSEYKLYLKLTDQDDKYGQYYLISGGYQGVLKNIDGNEIPVSSENTLFNVNDQNLVMASAGITPNNGYKWNKSNIIVYVPNNISTRYNANTRAGICSGISEWHSRTDAPATTIYASASVPYDVAVYMDTYGTTGWDGQTTTFSSGSTISSATVRINGSYNTSYYSETGLWKAISCHEFGHAIGMAHNTSSAASIMHVYTIEYYNVNGLLKLTVPQAADISGANVLY